jgi:hypothetical protein
MMSKGSATFRLPSLALGPTIVPLTSTPPECRRRRNVYGQFMPFETILRAPGSWGPSKRDVLTFLGTWTLAGSDADSVVSFPSADSYIEEITTLLT